ncbi:putative cytochrome P450 [Ixodes scapularis]
MEEQLGFLSYSSTTAEYTALLYATGVTALASFLLLFWYQHEGGRPSKVKLPPGPRGLPLLGNVTVSSYDFHYRKCTEWAQKYGPIFRFCIGKVNVVVLNDFASIKKYLSMEATLIRSQRSIFEGVTMGMTTLSGPAWVENRRFCLRVLKDLGFGKKSMEEHIKAVTLPCVEVQGCPLLLELQAPAHGSDIELVMDSSDAFMYSGNKLLHFRILPRECQTLTYNLYPLISGYVPLPRMHLVLSPGTSAAATLDDLLAEMLPSHIFIMPQTKNMNHEILRAS